MSAGPLFSHRRETNGDSETKVLYGLIATHKRNEKETSFGLGPFSLLFYLRYGNSSSNSGSTNSSDQPAVGTTIMFFFYLFYLYLSPYKRSWFCLPLLSFVRYVDNNRDHNAPTRPPTMWGFLFLGLGGVAISCAGKIFVASLLFLTLSVQSGVGESKKEFTTCLILYWRILSNRLNFRVLWPLFGIIHWRDEKTGGFTEYSVAWPLFRYRHRPQCDRKTLHLLFPFFKLVQSPEEFALRFLPFTWIKTVKGVMSRGFILLFYWEVNEEKQTIGVFPIFHMKRDKRTDTIKTIYALFMGMYRVTDTSITLMVTPLWWSHWKLSSCSSPTDENLITPAVTGSSNSANYDYYVHMLFPFFAYGNFTPTQEQKEGAQRYFENFMLCVPLLATLVSYRPRDKIINIFVLALAWYYHDLINHKKYVYGTIYGQYQRGTSRYHSVLIVLALWKEGLIMNDLDVWVLFGLIRYRYDGLTRETVTWFLPFYYVKHDERVQLPNGDRDCMNFTVRILILFKIEAHNNNPSTTPPPSTTFQVEAQKQVGGPTTTVNPPPVLQSSTLPSNTNNYNGGFNGGGGGGDGSGGAPDAYSYNYVPPPQNAPQSLPLQPPTQIPPQVYYNNPYVAPQPYQVPQVPMMVPQNLPPPPAHLTRPPVPQQASQQGPYVLQGYNQGY